MLNQMPFKSVQIDRRSTVSPHAHRLFERALWTHQRKQLLAALSGKNRQLITLNEIAAQTTITNRYSIRTRTVALDQIRGTVDKASAFDLDFYPAHERSENRWVWVATAFLRGISLPPVELILVGDTYFVVDGHHRISVARTLKYGYIDAVVTVWEVE